MKKRRAESLGRTAPAAAAAASGGAEKRPRNEKDAEIVVRCDLPLLVLTETLACACRLKCVSCAHKIVFGRDLPPHAKPNVRPEMCPRAKQSAPAQGEETKDVGLYPVGSRVLTVGDGDLSFSVSLAKHLGPENVVATTYESRESIIRSYPETGLKNLQELERLGCIPQHGVNAMDLAGTLTISNDDLRFDFVVFNFPCIATDVEGEDAQNEAMLENQELLRLFGKGVLGFLRPESGQLHVSHKTKAAFKHWDVPGNVVLDAEGLRPLYSVVFDRCAYPGYINRKARDRKSFPVTDAVIHVFGFRRSDFEFDINISCPQENESVNNWMKRIQTERLVPVTNGLVDHVIETVLRK